MRPPAGVASLLPPLPLLALIYICSSTIDLAGAVPRHPGSQALETGRPSHPVLAGVRAAAAAGNSTTVHATMSSSWLETARQRLRGNTYVKAVYDTVSARCLPFWLRISRDSIFTRQPNTLTAGAHPVARPGTRNLARVVQGPRRPLLSLSLLSLRAVAHCSGWMQAIAFCCLLLGCVCLALRRTQKQLVRISQQIHRLWKDK